MDFDDFEDLFENSQVYSDGSLPVSASAPSSPSSLLMLQNDNESVKSGAVHSQSRIVPVESMAAIEKIERVFESVAKCILDDEKELTIYLMARNANRNGAASAEDSSQGRAVTFPGKSVQEAWKFTVLLRILELSHAALVNGTRITKRDIYYSDPELFIKQGVVDRYVDDLAHTFGFNRSNLNIVAAAKGLIAGSLCFFKKDGTKVDCSLERDGMLVPDPESISFFDLSQTNWILVIEKEAAFRSLAVGRYWERSRAGKGILITAKGYPDIQTRSLLHKLSCSIGCPAILCLVDFDPDGISILSTYKHGSASLAHETDLAVLQTRWIGIKSSDIMFYQSQSQGQGLLDLTPRDRRIAMKMLEKELMQDGGLELEWRRELQVMLMLGIKAEIQIMNRADGDGMISWLDGKLLECSQNLLGGSNLP